MHFSNLLALASALALAPTVYSIGVATVELSYHDSCAPGRFPHNTVGDAEIVGVTSDSCTQGPAKHSFEIDAYAIHVNTITNETPYECFGVAVFSNDACVGLPETVVPIFHHEEAQSPCLQDDPFEKEVSFRLLCEDEKREAAPKEGGKGRKSFLGGLGV